MPRLVRNSLTSNWYSPSSGSVRSSACPPTVPIGRPSTCLSCDASCRTRNTSPTGGSFGIAERQRGDALGRREVALEQHRRDAEHVGVVVEAAARVVGRQHRARRRCAGRAGRESALAYSVRFSRCASGRPGIGRRRARRDRATSRGTTRARCAPRPEGRGTPGRRHHAAAHLADHLLPDVGVRGRRRPGSRRRALSPPVFSRWLWQVTQ